MASRTRYAVRFEPWPLRRQVRLVAHAKIIRDDPRNSIVSMFAASQVAKNEKRIEQQTSSSFADAFFNTKSNFNCRVRCVGHARTVPPTLHIRLFWRWSFPPSASESSGRKINIRIVASHSGKSCRLLVRNPCATSDHPLVQAGWLRRCAFDRRLRSALD